MKITKSANDEFQNKVNRWKANLQCDVCPCCGETRTSMQCYSEGIKIGGISDIPAKKSYWKGIFRPKYYNIDCYHCNTCGADWESEPYEVITRHILTNL